jgi:hypothetical protein
MRRTGAAGTIPKKARKVLLGMGQSLPWARGAEALTVKLPKKKFGKHAFVFKITLAE